MTNKLGIDAVKRLVFMTENEYLLHLGQHYEEKILQAQKNLEPVIRIISVNGTTSSIPLERASHLLKKYYKISGKTQTKNDNVIEMQATAEQSLNDEQELVIEEQKRMA